MSLDKSLKRKDILVRRRNVLTRSERIEKLVEDERFEPKRDSVFALPKVKPLTVVAAPSKGPEEKKAAEGEAAAEGAPVAEGAGAAKGGAKGAKGAEKGAEKGAKGAEKGAKGAEKGAGKKSKG